MIDLNALARSVRGQVIRPADAGYGEARRANNLMIDRRPSVIVRPLDTADVAAAVRWAAGAGLPISIRGGGHSVAGHSVGEGALMIDLANLRTVTVDLDGCVADVGGGAKLEDLDRATVAHGLAAPSGTYADTGVGGLVLGGGISYLIGSRGYACDALVGAELVTADGTIVDIDAEREPELLWALRGGGGNFGVVTRFRMALAPLTNVYAGTMTFVGPRVPELTPLMFDVLENAPDELMLAAVIGWDASRTPAFKLFAAWTGDPQAGEATFAPFRARSDLVDDGIGPMSYLDLQLLADRGGPRHRQYWKGHFVRAVTPELLGSIDAAHADAPLSSFVLIEEIHGEAQRIPDGSAAFGARAAPANISAIASWDDPADDEARIAWARTSAARWEPFSLQGGGYVNYSAADETASRVEQAYGAERFARLRAVKRRVDPENRFRFNANIPPA
jgi:FAD/FMN-containing dehydrogenase